MKTCAVVPLKFALDLDEPEDLAVLSRATLQQFGILRETLHGAQAPKAA